jgi:hypothetical protein
VTGLAGVAALAAGLGGWIRRPAAFGERVAATAAGLLLVAPTAWADAAGALLFGGTVAAHLARTRRAAVTARRRAGRRTPERRDGCGRRPAATPVSRSLASSGIA